MTFHIPLTAARDRFTVVFGRLLQVLRISPKS